MTINQFIKNLKYKSSILSIYDMYNQAIFSDTLGVFLTSLKRNLIGNEVIEAVYPYSCSDKDFYITLLHFAIQ